MNIRPKSIPKFQGGNNIWYLGLIDYDPTKYLISYDTSRLVNGDMSDNILSPWKSNISGYDVGRYLPINHGTFGEGKEHYNYTLGVEGLDYYKKFGEDLLDSNGNFTPTGEAWAKAVDILLPKGSNASFYDPKTGQLRTKWTTLYRDAHGRSAQTFTNLKDYVNHVRNDLLLGARHNVFLNKGKRYFYIDNLGQKHWVDPSVVDKYNVSKDPSEQGWEGTTYWDDYELTGLKDYSKTGEGGGIPIREKADSESLWDKLSQGFNKVAPDLIDALRLAGNMHNNERVYNEMKLAIIPNLLLSYHTHRQVVGDEATKLAYYRRATQGQTKAGLPFTSDADRLIAYMQEARRAGDELRAQGDLADNQRIRETSTESAAHTDANKERDTLVANQNTTELNKAKAAHHQLNALKYSADWTNLDLYLMGIQSKFLLKKAKQEAIEDLIKTLQLLENLANDPKIETAYNNLEAEAKKLYPNGEINYFDPRLKEARNKLSSARRKAYIEQYSLLYGKQGAKITKKDTTDKYLYRTSRDVVEHFRKMSKMTDDSRIRTMPKPVKLTSNPKKKLLLGGVAPFTIYRPLGIGGETTTLTSTSTDGIKSSKDTAAKDKLDMIKEMFKAVQNTGLPIDVNVVYRDLNNLFSRALAFGEELSTDDIASIYLQSMLKISNLKYSKENYDKALAVATSNESLNEFAVDASGNYIVQDKEGNLSIAKSLSEIAEKGLNPITNLQLLNLRAYSPNMAFLRGDSLITNIISNGMGINKIGALIKDLAGKLGSTEGKLEGISLVESGKIRKGLEMLAEAPNGHYKITTETKSLLEQINAALSYIENMLSPSLKAILNAHGGVKENIYLFLSSLLDYINEQTISPLTGKASDKDGKDSYEKIKSNPLMQLILGEGGVPRTWNLITKDSNVKMSIDGIEYSQLPKITEDMSLDKMLSESGIAGILDSKLGITFGDLSISPDQLKDVMYSNSGGMVVTLPCKIVNGHKEVNLGVKKTYEEAIQEVESKGLSKNSPEYYKMLGEVLKQKGLNSLLDNNGYPDRNKFGLFLVVEAYTTDKIKNLDTSSQYIEKVKNPDALLEERMIKALSTDSKKSNYNLDIDYWLYGDNVYRGTVFIPLNNNLNAAINASGDLISVENARELENKFQNFNKASNMKSSNSDVL